MILTEAKRPTLRLRSGQAPAERRPDAAPGTGGPLQTQVELSINYTAEDSFYRGTASRVRKYLQVPQHSKYSLVACSLSHCSIHSLPCMRKIPRSRRDSYRRPHTCSRSCRNFAGLFPETRKYRHSCSFPWGRRTFHPHISRGICTGCRSLHSYWDRLKYPCRHRRSPNCLADCRCSGACAKAVRRANNFTAATIIVIVTYIYALARATGLRSTNVATMTTV